MADQAQIRSVLWMCLASVAFGGRMIAQEGGSACKSQNVKTVTYHSPMLAAKPGQVNNLYFPGEFPKGHIGIKGINGELIYENGKPVPLTDVYLHHWSMEEASVAKEADSQRHLQHPLRHMSKHHRVHGMHIDATSSYQALHHNELHTEYSHSIINFLKWCDQKLVKINAQSS